MEESKYPQLAADGVASYYQEEPLESIEKIERIYGTKGAIYFCLGNMEKYRQRLGCKKEQPIEKDLIKIGWYKRKAMELLNKPENIWINEPESML